MTAGRRRNGTDRCMAQNDEAVYITKSPQGGNVTAVPNSERFDRKSDDWRSEHCFPNAKIPCCRLIAYKGASAISRFALNTPSPPAYFAPRGSIRQAAALCSRWLREPSCEHTRGGSAAMFSLPCLPAWRQAGGRLTAGARIRRAFPAIGVHRLSLISQYESDFSRARCDWNDLLPQGKRSDDSFGHNPNKKKQKIRLRAAFFSFEPFRIMKALLAKPSPNYDFYPQNASSA